MALTKNNQPCLLHDGTIFKLFSIAIADMQDGNLSGCEIYEKMKDGWKGRIDGVSGDFLIKTSQQGVLYLIGDYSFEKYFFYKFNGDSSIDEEGGAEYLIWYAEELLEFIDFHRIKIKQSYKNVIVNCISEADKLYNAMNEDTYYTYLEKKSDKISEIIGCIREDAENYINKLRHEYATIVAERLLHDRELCAWISKLVLTICLDEDQIDTQWCNRAPFPSWVRPTLLARERGRCANCDKELADDPSSQNHIDHIIPLAVGGFNDIVNLQILCDSCNLHKNKTIMPVKPSVPRYLSRALRAKSQKK